MSPVVWTILILTVSNIITIGILVLVIRRNRKKKKELKSDYEKEKSERNRLYFALEDIDRVRKEAADQRKKIDSGTSGDVANILNSVMSKPSGSSPGSGTP